MKTAVLCHAFQIFLLIWSISGTENWSVEDTYVPVHCDAVAAPTDHLLVEFRLKFENGTVGPSAVRPSQLYHFVLEANEDYPIYKHVKGMCKNATRVFSWVNSPDISLIPILYHPKFDLTSPTERLALEVKVVEITSQEDYQIFVALRERNNSWAIDLIEDHKGVNALDEWGQTPLMLATITQNLPIVASLLNTRMPTVNVNLAKSNGFTALFYAVEHAPAGILQALLRRGADSHAVVLQEGGRGNTPLHYACLLEKLKHAELLLEYGANPLVRNEFGKTPLQLLPADTVTSIKLHFRKLFEEATRKWSEVAVAGDAVREPIPYRNIF